MNYLHGDKKQNSYAVNVAARRNKIIYLYLNIFKACCFKLIQCICIQRQSNKLDRLHMFDILTYSLFSCRHSTALITPG